MNTDKRIIVIHHSADFDGLFCREIARRRLGELRRLKEAGAAPEKLS